MPKKKIRIFEVQPKDRSKTKKNMRAVSLVVLLSCLIESLALLKLSVELGGSSHDVEFDASGSLREQASDIVEAFPELSNMTGCEAEQGRAECAVGKVVQVMEGQVLERAKSISDEVHNTHMKLEVGEF